MSEEVDTTISILESYHQNGGTYVIPVEVISDVEDLLAEQETVIKKVREKVSTLNTTPVNCGDYELRYGDYDITLKRKRELLEILDKKKEG